MYYLDGGWRRQALVYFGERLVSSANVAVCSGSLEGILPGL